jgi:hypothetical protein
MTYAGPPLWHGPANANGGGHWGVALGASSACCLSHGAVATCDLPGESKIGEIRW